MLFTTNTVKTEEINSVREYIEEYESEVVEVSNVSKYITSLVSNKYQASVEAIANTVVGSRRTKKMGLQQVLQESFFSGANRFGNNFIA